MAITTGFKRIVGGLKKLAVFRKTVLTQFIVDDDRRLIYVVVPKTGCSSVKQSFADGTESGDKPLHKLISKKLHTAYLTDEQNEYFKFTFVRNPFDRLASCYTHKIVKSDVDLRKNYWGFAKIEKQEDFSSFVKKVARIPDMVSDAHFQSQYALLYQRGKPLYDSLGHFETLARDFEPIRERYDLRPLPHIHHMRKGDWRDFYTPELAEIVYQRYRRDFELFGYEEEYKKLYSYLEQRSERVDITRQE